MRVMILAILSLTLTACGTPQSVRQLSDQQTAHISAAVTLIEAENVALRQFAAEQRDASIARYQARYEAYRNRVPTRIREEQDPNQIAVPLDNLDRLREVRDTRIAAVNARYEERVQSLESRVSYMRAILLAQQQLDRAIDRDDPLTRMARRVLGDEEYNAIEGRLNDMQTAWRENEENVAALVAAARGETLEEENEDE